MHHAAHRQRDRVVADAMLERTVLPEARNRKHDHALIDLAEILVAESVPGQHSRTVVLRDHIDAARELPHNFHARRRLQVDTDALLAAIVLNKRAAVTIFYEWGKTCKVAMR